MRGDHPRSRRQAVDSVRDVDGVGNLWHDAAAALYLAQLGAHPERNQVWRAYAQTTLGSILDVDRREHAVVREFAVEVDLGVAGACRGGMGRLLRVDTIRGEVASR